MKHTIELLICDHAGKPDLGERHLGEKVRDIPVLYEDFLNYQEEFPDGCEDMILTAGRVVHRCEDEYDVTIIISCKERNP